MAAYVDHGLSLAERAQVETHLASCRQCTALLAGVVRTVAEVAAFIPDTGVTEATPYQTRRPVLVALGAAAAVIAVLVVPPVLGPWLERDAGLVSLVDSVGEQRSVLGRLTGGFPHAPLSVPPAGGQGGLAAGTDRVLLTSGRIRESFGELATPSRLHALGVSQLLAGRYDDAVQSLVAASREQPANARYLSDVAAVQLERARLGLRPDDLPRALAAADRARRLDPSLNEAWFNRALAVSALSLTDQARTAWTEYLERDSVSPWASEARARLEELAKPTPAAAWAAIEGRLEQSIDAASADAAVRAQTTEARNFLENTLLPKWSAAVSSGRNGSEELDQVRLMAEAFLRVSGDALYTDTVNAIQRAAARGPSALIQLAIAHTSFSNAAANFGNDRFADARLDFVSARNDFIAHESPFAFRTATELGAVAYATGRSDEALELLNVAYPVSANRNYLLSAGRAAWVQGLVAFGQGRLGDAQERYEAALAIFERMNDAEQTAGAHNLLASLFGYLGDEQAAWRHREAAMPILSISSSYRLRYGILVGTTAAARRQDLGGALVLQDAVVQLAHEWGRPIGIAESLGHRAELRAAVGRRAEAVQDIGQARAALQQISDEALRSRFEVTVLAVESILLRPQSPQLAAQAAERAIRLVDARRDRRRLPQLNLLLAKANIVWGRNDAAERALTEGIQAFEAERSSLADEGRLSVLDDSWELFETSVHLAIRTGDIARAFELSERARGRTIAETKRIPTRSLNEVEQSLAADEAIVGLNQFEDALAVWLIRRTGTKVILRPVRKVDALKFVDLQEDEIRGELSSPRAGSNLFEEIVRPIQDDLKSVTRVIVVPDPTYQNVQFAALWDRSRRRFLVDDVAVQMAPSASAMAYFTRHTVRDTADLEPLVFGAPDERSRARAHSIAALYPKAVLRTGSDATGFRFLADAPRRSLIHLAAPTVANAAFPFLSRLALADEPGSRHSGQVLGRDIASQALSNTRLVVIDEVATTGSNRGEGTLSLARAFITAGVPAVLGTLPGADEAAIRDLIVGFHQRMAAGMTAVDALTDLQRNVLQQNGRRLGAWSALVLYGSDR